MYVVTTLPMYEMYVVTNSPKETQENSLSVLLFVLMLTS